MLAMVVFNCQGFLFFEPKTMKIAVFHNLPPGGAMRALYEHLRILSRTHGFYLYTTNTDFGSQKLFPLHKLVKKTFFFKTTPPRNFVAYLRFVYRTLPQIHATIARKIDKEKYDVVLATHDFWTKSPYLLRFLKTPNIYLCHEVPREFYEPSSWHFHSFKAKIAYFFRKYLKTIDKENVKKADKILTVSRFSQSIIKKVYKRRANIIRNGVDSEFFKPLRGSKRKRIFLSVGSFNRFKGHDFLIRAIANSDCRSHYTLCLVGTEGTDKDFLLNLAHRLGVKLSLKKKISNSALRKLYSQSYAFLYAPRNEPFGLVALEAMACGLPVVGVKEGGLQETIKENIGWLVERDIKKFSAVIDYLAKNPKKIEALRRKVRQYVKKEWGWNRGATRLICHLKKIASNKK